MYQRLPLCEEVPDALLLSLGGAWSACDGGHSGLAIPIGGSAIQLRDSAGLAPDFPRLVALCGCADQYKGNDADRFTLPSATEIVSLLGLDDVCSVALARGWSTASKSWRASFTAKPSPIWRHCPADTRSRSRQTARSSIPSNSQPEQGGNGGERDDQSS